MMPEMRFLFVCFGVSLILSYVWWCHLRAWILRARLFQIRDQLWDAMRAEGMLDHPAHRQMREVINSLIAAASTLNWIPFLIILVTNKDLRECLMSEPSVPVISRTQNKVGLCVADYLLRMTLTGRLLLMFAVVFNFAADLRRSIAEAAGAMARANAFCPTNP
jgi:hypothetical protein